MHNAIYLRHRRKIIVPPGQGPLPQGHLATLLKNIESLGFTFSQPLIARVASLSVEQALALYHQLTEDLRAMLGAHVQFRPMYPGFPSQVMEMERWELYINAILHYLTLELPDEPARRRLPLLDRTDLSVIELGDEADFQRIFAQLVGARTSISAADRADLAWFVEHHRGPIEPILPDSIPLKENAALLAALLVEHRGADAELLGRYIRTATDVLRLAVALSGGDISLAASTRFRSFRRAERRLLLGLLERCGGITEDMLRHRLPWVRLGERLHPFEWRRQLPGVYAAFDVLRNGRPFSTFNGAVERALAERDVARSTELLQARPGEFARRLDHLLRLADDWRAVTDEFAGVAGRVSTPVLLQVQAHFKSRHIRHELRTFFPKGNVARAQAIENRLPPLDPAAVAAVLAACRAALLARFSALPPLGRVYIDPRLHDYCVPFAQRSASKALRTIVRGSRLAFPAGTTIRFFLWWREGVVGGRPTGRVDIDLSSVLYDGDWRYMEHISYTNLKSEGYQAAHSGDIVSAPDGACEFIDIDIASALAYGGRYVVMSLNSFTEQPFCNLPECRAGWMMRQEPDSGEVFEPRTVQDTIDLAADTRACIPVILDLAERKVVWADIALRANPRWHNNVEGNQRGLFLMGKAMTTLVKPSLYDLFELHAAARGQPAGPAEADTVFAVDRGVTPFDNATIIAEYL